MDESEPLAVWASGILKQLHDLFEEANLKAPRPLAYTKREREKQSSRDGVVERLRRCVSRPDELRRILADTERAESESELAKVKVELDKAAAIKREEESRQLQNEAVEWLLARGKKIGTDFSVADAVQVANGIAYAEECARLEDEGEYMSFSGQNCEGPCAGWNPSSNRCDCGNRRVSFTEVYGHSFKSPSVEAEAY